MLLGLLLALTGYSSAGDIQRSTEHGFDYHLVKPIDYRELSARVKAILREWENRLLIEYLVRDAATGQRLTKGMTAQVAVDMASGEM